VSKIDPRLFKRLKDKLALSERRIYELIEAKARSASLDRHLAAVALANEHKINTSRFVTKEDLAVLREAARFAPVVATPISSAPAVSGKRKASTRREGPKRKENTVWVVHGRDTKARDAVFSFLRTLGLRPIEWNEALKLTRHGSPYVGTVLDKALDRAAAVVALLTPDDVAKLKSRFLKASDKAHERELTGQARANVLFEAGMAFGRDERRTVLVMLGELRPFSDVGGRHAVHLTNSAESRQEFATKLENAGCTVNRDGTDWLSAGDFEP
jgi:predicted nucleotide-binding protein